MYVLRKCEANFSISVSLNATHILTGHRTLHGLTVGACVCVQLQKYLKNKLKLIKSYGAISCISFRDVLCLHCYRKILALSVAMLACSLAQMTVPYLEHSEDDSKEYNDRHTACYCHGSNSGEWHGLVWINVSHGISMNCSHTAVATQLNSCCNPTFSSWWWVLTLSCKYEAQSLPFIFYTTGEFLNVFWYIYIYIYIKLRAFMVTEFNEIFSG